MIKIRYEMLKVLKKSFLHPLYAHEIYFNGTNLEEEVAPIPGRPCLIGL